MHHMPKVYIDIYLRNRGNLEMPNIDPAERKAILPFVAYLSDTTKEYQK